MANRQDDHDHYQHHHRPSLISSPSPVGPLQELEPSPVEENFITSDPEKLNPYFPSTTSSANQDLDPDYYSPRTSTNDFSASLPSSTSSTLGLFSPHHLPRLLVQLQRYSTYPIILFSAVHLTNTSLLPLATRSVVSSDTYLLLTRPYYQSAISEKTLIFAPVAIHVFSGIALRIYRRRVFARRHGAETYSERRRIPWPKLSLQSGLGYLLYPCIASHVYVNRILPLREQGDSSGVGLRYVAHGFARHPLIANLGYTVLVVVATWHFVGGMAKWLRVSKEYIPAARGGGADGDYGKRRRRRRGWIIDGITAVVALVWLAGGLGVVGRGGPGRGWEARGWDKLYRKVPSFGEWLA